MHYSENRTRILLRKYFRGTLNSFEYEELIEILRLEIDEAGVDEIIAEEVMSSRYDMREKEVNWEAMLVGILNREQGGVLSTGGKEKLDNSAIRQFDNGASLTRGIDIPEHNEVKIEAKVKRMQIIKWIAAASIIGFVVWGLWFVVGRDKGGDLPVAVTPKVEDVKAPEVNRAMITLSDGRVVYLDSVGNGALANVSGVEVMKMGDGKIVYREASSVNRDASTGPSMTYNTLTNPRGSKVIDITLSDGSRVWLNAGSSLRYPVVFGGDKREVELEGEGYFEVNSVNRESSIVKAPSSSPKGGGTLRRKVPFLVKSGGVVTEVLGTHFNVKAYGDEGEIRVTLLEGRVNVFRESEKRKGVNRESVKLGPGQSAVARALGNETIQVKSNVDVEEVMAWKNGRFQFSRASLQEVMRQLARWYDVDVYYEGAIPDQEFGGKLQRNLSLIEMLDILTKSQVQYKIEGRKLTIMK